MHFTFHAPLGEVLPPVLGPAMIIAMMIFNDDQGVAEEGYREGSQCLRVLCGKVSSSSP